GHGLPACRQLPDPLQVSAPLQNKPSSQPVPLASLPEQFLADSLHESLYLRATLLPAHGLPACRQLPDPLQVSAPLQNRPSSQPVPLASLPEQFLADSLHESLPTRRSSDLGHGLPACRQLPDPLQVSAPLQNKPSSQPVPLASLPEQF